MRSYLDNYLTSLSTGEQVLADQFIWKDRTDDNGLSSIDSSQAISTRYSKVRPMTQVNRNDFISLFSITNDAFDSLFDRANFSASYHEALDRQIDTKMALIEATLEELEDEVDSWEEKLCSSPEASYSIRRDFGQEGLRPIVEYASTLELLSTTVAANTEVTYTSGLVKAIEPEALDEELFTTEPGLQVRFTFNFVPGKIDKIHLEPLSGIGTMTIYEMRFYGAQGNLLDATINDVALDRTLEYSITPVIVSRIEIDAYCTAYNITEETVTNTVEKTRRIVIPGKTETVLKGYKEVTTTTPARDYGLTGPRGPVSKSIDPRWGVSYYDQVYYGTPYINELGGTGSIPRSSSVYDSVSEALAAGKTKFYVLKDGELYQYSYITEPASTKTSLVPIYETISIPEQILYEPYTETFATTIRKYNYELGLKNLTCSSSYYTEAISFLELVRFDGGLPSNLTLSTNEYMPVGSYINFFLIGKDNSLTPIAPYNREWTTDILSFNNTGESTLCFYPQGEIYFYKDEGSVSSLPVNGRYVLGPQANVGVYSPMVGAVHWARYQPDLDKCNVIPYSSRIASYYSNNGSLGEYFDSIPSTKRITLAESPYVDTSRLDTTGYSPVTIIIDGYSTVDLTNYSKFEEEDFPVNPVYSDNQRVISYKVRDNTIFFDTLVERPVRVFYEFEAQYAYVLITMGVIHKKAACPVLYSYQLSYI